MDVHEFQFKKVRARLYVRATARCQTTCRFRECTTFRLRSRSASNMTRRNCPGIDTSRADDG